MPDCYYSPAGVLTSYVFLVTKFAAIGVGSRAEVEGKRRDRKKCRFNYKEQMSARDFGISNFRISPPIFLVVYVSNQKNDTIGNTIKIHSDSEVRKVIGQDVIKIQTANSGTFNNKSVMKIYDNGCECIKYHCGCCQFIELDAISINGTLCANASYLDRDYGISITITYNHITIINETVTARDPPPICIGENIVGSLKIDICLEIYDIDVDYNGFHACFDILGKIMKLKVYKLELGCIGSMQHKKKQYINNITFNLLPLFLQKKHSVSPNVIMV